MFADIGENHLLLLDPVEATSADIRRRLAQFPVESGSQVVDAPPALAAGFEKATLDQCIENPPCFITADVEDSSCMSRCDTTCGSDLAQYLQGV